MAKWKKYFWKSIYIHFGMNPTIAEKGMLDTCVSLHLLFFLFIQKIFHCFALRSAMSSATSLNKNEKMIHHRKEFKSKVDNLQKLRKESCQKWCKIWLFWWSMKKAIILVSRVEIYSLIDFASMKMSHSNYLVLNILYDNPKDRDNEAYKNFIWIFYSIFIIGVDSLFQDRT